MSEITLKEVEVQKLNLQPDDTLFVTVNSEDLDQEILDHLAKGFKDALPNTKAVVFGIDEDNNIGFRVVKQENNVKVKFKKLHEDAVLPSYSKPGDAGMDIAAVSDGEVVSSEDGNSLWYYVEYKTGLAVEIPPGFVGLLFPRSSVSKTALSLANCVGVCDSSFRGEICFRFKIDYGCIREAEKLDGNPTTYKKGDRIGQLMILPYPTIEAEFVDELSETERGSGGFGSTNT